MKLFTKEIDKQLFAQYPKGAEMGNQKVVAKIFDPIGNFKWFIMNSDPENPDYLWAIVKGFEIEMGSVSRSELEETTGRLGFYLERDLGFSPTNAKEIWDKLMKGEHV